MRFRTFLFTALAELTTISTSTSAHAGASDYAFEPAQADGQGRAWRCPVSDPARHGAGQYGRHDCQARGQAIFRAGCLSLPFALVGGLWLMWWMGFNLSVAVAVGFIALAGVAAQTGVVMLIYLDHALEARRTLAAAAGRAMNRADLYAVERVRPKIMTVIAIMAGLLPILWSHGTGSEVMQRIAVPMIGGMVSSTILTLLVSPPIYALVKGVGMPRTPSV